jgi:hypothetical protein
MRILRHWFKVLLERAHAAVSEYLCGGGGGVFLPGSTPPPWNRLMGQLREELTALLMVSSHHRQGLWLGKQRV